MQEPAIGRPWLLALPSFIDGLCVLSAGCARFGVADSTLAFAGAEADEVSSGVSRVLLAAHALLSGLPSSVGMIEGPGEQHKSATLEAALEAVAAGGFDWAFAARSAMSALRSCAGSSGLSDGLRQLLSLWKDGRGSGGADEALEHVVQQVRRAARNKKAPLTAAVKAAADLLTDRDPACVSRGDILASAAAQADAVWSMAPRVPSVETRAALLLDATASCELASGIMLVGEGCDARGKSARIVFDTGLPGGQSFLDTFAPAVGIESASLRVAARPSELLVEVARDESSAIAQYLMGAGRPADAETPWSWPAAEVARPVVAPAMTFSASRLNSFAKCPRRWFFEYLCDAVEDRSSVQATYGRVFHEALETLHRHIRIPSTFAHEEILERLSTELDAAFAKWRHEFSSKLEYEVSRFKARQVAEHYVRWLTKEAAARPFEVAEVELSQRWFAGGHAFIGFVDRIDRPTDGGPLTIFDYKTGRIDEDPREYLRKIREGEEAQLALYYSMRRAQGEDIGRIALISIRDPRDSVWMLALDVTDDEAGHRVEKIAAEGLVRATCTAGDLETSLSRLLQRCDLLTSAGLNHFSAGARPPCSYCAYANACREKPQDEERIFAR